MKKFEKVTFLGEGAYSEPLTLKRRSATYIFIIFMDTDEEYVYTEEVRKNLK